MIIHYQEARFDDVLYFFAKSFKPRDGEKIDHVEFFVDPVKNVVVFKLYVREKEDTV